MIVLLLLLAMPAWGVVEDLAVNGDGVGSIFWAAGSAGGCGASSLAPSPDIEQFVDEDPDGSPDGSHALHSGTNNALSWDFPTPTANPSTATNAQIFHVIMTRTQSGCTAAAGGTDPEFSIKVFCGGVDNGQPLITAQAITALDQSVRVHWTFGTAGPATCAADGSDLEIDITGLRQGSGGDRRWAGIESIEWEVDSGPIEAGGFIMFGLSLQALTDSIYTHLMSP